MGKIKERMKRIMERQDIDAVRYLLKICKCERNDRDMSTHFNYLLI
jgi:hypothetical protein